MSNDKTSLTDKIKDETKQSAKQSEIAKTLRRQLIVVGLGVGFCLGYLTSVFNDYLFVNPQYLIESTMPTKKGRLEGVVSDTSFFRPFFYLKTSCGYIRSDIFERDYPNVLSSIGYPNRDLKSHQEGMPLLFSSPLNYDSDDAQTMKNAVNPLASYESVPSSCLEFDAKNKIKHPKLVINYDKTSKVSY